MPLSKPPLPAFTVEISVGACDWDTLTHRLVEAAEHVRECGPSCKLVWGGGGTHGHVRMAQRDVTEAQYEAELKQWFDSERAAPDAAEVRRG